MGFKFDKSDKEPDFNLGVDDSPAAAPAKKPAFINPNIAQPVPQTQPETTPVVEQTLPPTTPTLPTQPPVSPVAAYPTVPNVAIPAEPPTSLYEPAVEEKQTTIYQPPTRHEPTTKAAVAPIMEPTGKGKKNLFKNLKGNRKKVFYIRIAAGIVAVIITLTGLRAIFFPPQFPSPEEVTTVISNNIGFTGFPTEAGSAFIINFTKTLFTINPETTSIRNNELKKYISGELLGTTNVNIVPPSFNETPTTLGLTTDPLITEINPVDANNATYTVLVKLSNGTELNIIIPLYYDKTTNALAVSSAMSIVPGFNTAEVPSDNHSLNWQQKDTEIATAFKPDLEKYFQAWGASDLTSITRYVTTDSTLITKEGLKGVLVFDSLPSLTVKGIAPNDTETDPTVREAYALVVWKDAKNPVITYRQGYLLTIKLQETGQWSIADLTGTVVKK
jgi:hypothetical protein